MVTALGHLGSVVGIGEEVVWGQLGSFTVDATNNKIDIKEDAGGELNATVASATYSAGLTSAIAGSLCLAIKTALEVAGAGTYTVTFDEETKKFTIAVAGAIAAVQIMWKTGTNGADGNDTHIGDLTGFSDAADGANAASDTSDSAVNIVTKFARMISDNAGVDEERLESGAMNVIYDDVDDSKQGRIRAPGDFGIELRYEGQELFFKHAMGSLVSSTEVATFVIESGVNDKIDLKEDAGGELTVTLSPGTYIMGESGAVAATLCKEIKTQLDTQAGTYTVTFSNTTKKLTIAVAGGAAAVQLLPVTGTNTATSAGPTLGFAADSASAGSIIADTAVVTVFQHTFALSDALPTGLTIEVDRDLHAFASKGCKINTFAVSQDTSGILLATIGYVGKDMFNTVVTSPTLPTKSLIIFSDAAVTYNGTKYATNASFEINNNMKTDRDFLGSRTIKEPLRSGTKRAVTGTFTIEFETPNEYDDFRAATSRALQLKWTGGVIKTGWDYYIQVDFDQIKLTGGVPKISDPGPIMLELPFKAYAADASNLEVDVIIQNTLSSIT